MWVRIFRNIDYLSVKMMKINYENWEKILNFIQNFCTKKSQKFFVNFPLRKIFLSIFYFHVFPNRFSFYIEILIWKSARLMRDFMRFTRKSKGNLRIRCIINRIAFHVAIKCNMKTDVRACNRIRVQGEGWGKDQILSKVISSCRITSSEVYLWKRIF